VTPLTRRFLIVLACVVAAVATGFSIEVLLSHRSGWPFGHTQAGHAAGWAGLVLTLSVFGYSVKKRSGPTAAWPKGWFLLHQMMGVAGPSLILIHSGSHLHALVPILALLAMGVTVVSGVVGVVVHRKALSLMKSQRAELLCQGLSSDEVEDRLYDLAASEKAFRTWRIIHVPMSVIFLVLTILHIIGALYFGGW
jgi:hypothetical protein